MKKASILLSFLIICIALISSCGKRDENNGVYVPGNHFLDSTTTGTGTGTGTGTSSGTISASINGSAYSSSNITFTTIGGFKFASSVTSPSSNLSLYLDSLTLGTHKLQSTLPYISYISGPTFLSNSKSPLKVGAGSIIITSNTGTTISGTFSGVVYNQTLVTDSLIITNGVFTNLTY